MHTFPLREKQTSLYSLTLGFGGHLENDTSKNILIFFLRIYHTRHACISGLLKAK